jgi:hypothetical protein
MNSRRNANGESSATRFTFVEMLFALAIGEVAVIASHVVHVDAPWQDKLPVTFHLILGASLIATSWLGWTASLRRRHEERAEQPFSFDFLALSVDVLLVVFYFILVRQAEISEDSPYTLCAPSATPEAGWLLVIFATYVAWDLITDVLKQRPRPSFVSGVGLFFASAACSLICVGLAYLVWALARGDQSKTAVLAFDGALLCLVFLFRVIKGPIENNLRKIFTQLQAYKAFEKEREPVVAENKIFIGLLLGYFLLVYLATRSSGLDAYWLP